MVENRLCEDTIGCVRIYFCVIQKWLPNVADNVCKKSILIKNLVFETSNLL